MDNQENHEVLRHNGQNIRKAFRASAARSNASVSIATMIDDIVAVRPDLKDEMFYIPAHGITSLTVMTVREVFKAPKTSGFKAYLKREYERLQALQGKGLPIPVVTCVGDDMAFYGMTRLPGVWASEVVDKMNKQKREKLGKAIGTFMHVVADTFSRPPHDDWHYESDNIHAVEDNLEIYKDRIGKEFDFCKREIGILADHLRDKDPVLMHDDLHMRNILINPDTLQISGIVDFGDLKPYHAEQRLFIKGGGHRRHDIEKAAWHEYARLHEGVDVRDRYRFNLYHDICFDNDFSKSLAELKEMMMPKPPKTKGYRP